MQNRKLFVLYYEIDSEDAECCGIDEGKLIPLRRGVLGIPVFFNDEVHYKAVKSVLDNSKKQELRSQRCLIRGKKDDTLKVCRGCCKACTDEDKKNVIQKPVLMCDALERLSPRENAVDDFIDRETVRVIISKMDTINQKYARYLRYRLKEMSIQDIADVEGKAKSTVKETLDRAYALARKIYEGEI